MAYNIRKQIPKDKVWRDETGVEIPYNRTTPYERTAESTVHKLAVDAAAINRKLTEFKSLIREKAQELYDLFASENGGKIGEGKGGCTFYNFDRTIKVERSVNDQITFDENTIELAQDKLNEVLTEGLNGAKDFVKPLVMDAFTKKNGQLDPKKVLGLRRWEDRVNHPKYSEAMRLIGKAIRRPTSKEYHRVWVKDERGEWKDVCLNFAYL